MKTKLIFYKFLVEENILAYLETFGKFPINHHTNHIGKIHSKCVCFFVKVDCPEELKMTHTLRTSILGMLSRFVQLCKL